MSRPDTTDPIRAEAERQESELRYQVLVESVQAILWRSDARTFQFDFVSREAEALLGYPVERWTTEPAFWVEHVHPADRDWAARYCRVQTDALHPHELEYRMIAADGRVVWLRDVIRVLAEDGQPRWLVGIMLDITARKRAEQVQDATYRIAEAANTAADLPALLRRIHEIIHELMPARNFYIAVLDPATDTLSFPYFVDEVDTRGMPRKLGKGLTEYVLRTGQPLLATPRVYEDLVARGEVELIGPPSIDWLGVPLKVHERTIGVVVMQSYTEGTRYGEQERDILAFVSTQVAVAIERKRAEEALRHAVTEHHHLEEQIRQAVKVEAVGRLAGGIAHDFNNILTAILGTTQLLQRELSPDAPHYADVEEIRRAAERAADLTRQLLAYSRRQVLAPRVLDLNVIVRGLDHMLRRLIGEDVELINVLAPQLAPVRADPGQVEQVIVNLAINARDAMPGGGKLTIETANIDLDAAFVRAHPGAIAGSYVQLRVDDTGAGMDAETRAHLFEPFFTTKSVGKGTGLGLATVYGIVKQSGGYISVDSEPGRGTVFAIFLPRTTGTPEPPAGAPSPGQPARGTETILFVEDEETVRTLSARALGRLGYQVLAAPGGADALQLAERHAGLIHLVLTDVVMPGLGGRELVRQLAAIRPDMKVLYISGYSDEAIIQHGVLDPGTAFLQKPFTPDRLASKVREVLDAANTPLGAAKTP